MLPHAAALEELAQLRQKVAAQEVKILSLKAARVPKVWVDYATNVKPAVLDDEEELEQVQQQDSEDVAWDPSHEPTDDDDDDAEEEEEEEDMVEGEDLGVEDDSTFEPQMNDMRWCQLTLCRKMYWLSLT